MSVWEDQHPRAIPGTCPVIAVLTPMQEACSKAGGVGTAGGKAEGGGQKLESGDSGAGESEGRAMQAWEFPRLSSPPWAFPLSCFGLRPRPVTKCHPLFSTSSFCFFLLLSPCPIGPGTQVLSWIWGLRPSFSWAPQLLSSTSSFISCRALGPEITEFPSPKILEGARTCPGSSLGPSGHLRAPAPYLYSPDLPHCPQGGGLRVSSYLFRAFLGLECLRVFLCPRWGIAVRKSRDFLFQALAWALLKLRGFKSDLG